MNNESCPVDGWHVTVQFSPSQSLSAEAFFSSTWFPFCLPSLTPSIHKAYSEMLYFEEHVQRETFNQSDIITDQFFSFSSILT